MIFLKGLTGLLLLLLLLWMAATYCVPVRQARADDAVAQNCQSIRELREQYRGVSLTPYQKTIKAQLVRYYREHCASHRASRSKPQAD